MIYASVRCRVDLAQRRYWSDAAVVQEPREGIPALQHMLDRSGEVMAMSEFGELLPLIV